MIALSGFPYGTHPDEVARLLSTFGPISYFEFVFGLLTAYVEFEFEEAATVSAALNRLLWKFRHPLTAASSYANVFRYEFIPY